MNYFEEVIVSLKEVAELEKEEEVLYKQYKTYADSVDKVRNKIVNLVKQDILTKIKARFDVIHQDVKGSYPTLRGSA